MSQALVTISSSLFVAFCMFLRDPMYMCEREIGVDMSPCGTIHCPSI